MGTMIQYVFYLAVLVLLAIPLGHLPMIFSAKWQNFCAEKTLMPMLV